MPYDPISSRLQPTAEQRAIMLAAKSRHESLMCNAYAGCTKTSALEFLIPELPTQSIIALTFNKKNKLDLIDKLPPWVTVQNFNGLGHSAFASAIGRRLTLDDKKVASLVTAHYKKSGSVSDDEWTNLRNLVKKAKGLGLVPSRYPAARKSLLPDDSWGWETVSDALGIELTEQLMVSARQVLCHSIDLALAGTIDFDDQIYMSTLFHGIYKKFHTVIVDEYQDLNPLNVEQVRKCFGSRLIVVGDQLQGIYAFRGADVEVREKLRSIAPAWIDLPLTVTWRCPQLVVARQQDHARGFTAAPNAPQGEVLDLTSGGWNIGGGDNTIVHNVRPNAILCRNNAPLISLAFSLIRRRIGVKMMGRDFGKSLSSLVKKVGGQEQSLEAFTRRFTEWKDKEIRLALAADKEDKADRVADQFESIMAVLEDEEVRSTSELLIALEKLFERAEGQITLSTGHKAKGLEWHTVLHLDPWRIPSKWAKQAADNGNPTQLQQEQNLAYVIETRAKHTLILANLEQFGRPSASEAKPTQEPVECPTPTAS